MLLFLLTLIVLAITHRWKYLPKCDEEQLLCSSVSPAGNKGLILKWINKVSCSDFDVRSVDTVAKVTGINSGEECKYQNVG